MADALAVQTERLGLAPERLVHMYRQMRRIRHFEEEVDRLYQAGRIWGTFHLYIGQEAVAVGAVEALEPDDYITSTHRGHGHSIAKGASIPLMMAELRGKETGYCRGRGGSMHIADVDAGNLGANGIVGGGIPIATGAALACRKMGLSRVVLCFFGDGAVAQGAFHEAVNFAAVFQLPVVYLCENNQYAMSMPVRRGLGNPDIAARAAAYGIPGKTVDGNDVLAVYAAVREAVDRARSGGGPTLLEARTYRWRGHSKSDANRYRTREEIEAWKQRCPIRRFEEQLVAAGVLSAADVERIAQEVREEIQAAIEFAEQQPDPDVSALAEGVYA
ncbi:MAG: pyruvate dehydrogenase (acetyl-transferring) E1 component subunit alpha [Limnochordales bacterium]|nr:pyruvate dehydrogenase (acetyl-transferring) E1 component subunit alpha [Limnochordales bacterium]